MKLFSVLKLTKEELSHLWNSWEKCYWCIDETLKDTKQEDCRVCQSIHKKIDRACKEVEI